MIAIPDQTIETIYNYDTYNYDTRMWLT